MSSDTIELQCPRCRKLLEIDVGFGGGVCRCSSCGQLMTVPRVGSRQGVRPTRPSSPGGHAAPRKQRPGDPNQSAGEVADVVEAADARDADDAADTLASPGEATPQAELVEALSSGTLTTESGRTIQIEPTQPIPTAHLRRHAVRFTSAAVVLIITGSLAAAGIAAIVILTTSSPPNDHDDTAQAEQIVNLEGYDPSGNPFKLGVQNVLGVEPVGRVVVLIDASAASRSWLSLVKDVLAAGLGQKGHEAQVIFFNEDANVTYPPKPSVWDAQTVSEYVAAADEVVASGVSDPAAAMKAAAGSPAEHVIVIKSPSPESITVLSLEARIDVFVINGEDRDDKQTAETYGGRYVSLAADQIRQWRR